MVVLEGDHAILKGIPASWTKFLGYQRAFHKKDARVLATIGGADPLIVVWQVGKKRSTDFTSDLAPHWGTHFVKWSHYGSFWNQSIQWLASEKCYAARARAHREEAAPSRATDFRISGVPATWILRTKPSSKVTNTQPCARASARYVQS